MEFLNKDLHECLKVSLSVLIDIAKNNPDPIIKGNAAINLANITFDIWDRQNKQEELENYIEFLEDNDEDYETE